MPKMKCSLLLASVAALFLATGTATAQSPKVELPDAMLGAWCGQWGWQFPDEDAEHWWRTEDVEDCGNRGGIHVRKDGWDYARFGPQGSCKFVSVQLLKDEPTEANRPGDVYRVHADCKKGTETWSEAYDVQTMITRPTRKPIVVEKGDESCMAFPNDPICIRAFGKPKEPADEPEGPWLIRWELPAEG
jgi:hypothetical protein